MLRDPENCCGLIEDQIRQICGDISKLISEDGSNGEAELLCRCSLIGQCDKPAKTRSGTSVICGSKVRVG